jgi:hypothetical protein
MTEAEIQARILLAYGALPGVRLFRNTVGFGYQGDVVSESRGVVVLKNARPVTFGLCPGSSDIIGWNQGRFLAIEVKAKAGRASDKQNLFGEAVERDGGFFRISRSVDDLRSLFLK